MRTLKSENHRYHDKLHEYWDALRGDRPFPQESEIDPDKLGEIWASCFLISIDDVTRRVGYRYSYLGDSLIEAYGDDVKNPDIVMCLISTATASMAQKFDEVITKREPVIDESEFVNLKHLNIQYRTCMLPLGTADGVITHIIGCMRWRVY